jgi:hypothetical protein
MVARRWAPGLAVACWLGLTALAPLAGATLPYDLTGLLGGPNDPQAMEPGEQYPPTPLDRTLSPAVRQPQAVTPAGARKTDWKLSLDASVTADSNVTNAGDLAAVTIIGGGGSVTVPVDPRYRSREGVGVGASAAASLRLPVSAEASLAFDAEGYVLAYPGAVSDDASGLVAAGVRIDGRSGSGTVQLIGFDRWYGGVSATRGAGLRANWRQDVGRGRHVAFYLDARRQDSDWGDPLTGDTASLYLTYDLPLDPTLTAVAGVYGRRDWMRDDAFSDSEVGAYGSLTHYLGTDFTGGVSAGLGRAWYDSPLAYLSPDPRRDWRYYASLWVSTRKPVLLGFYPSLTYTYSRTSSSIPYYSADRHRLRLGVNRSF